MNKKPTIGSRVICVLKKYEPDYGRQPIEGNVYRVESTYGEQVFALYGVFQERITPGITPVYMRHFISYPDEVDRAKGVT